MDRPVGRNRSRIGGFAVRWVAVGVPAVFLAVFFVYPVGAILWRGLGAEGLGPMSDLFASSRTRGVVWFTVWQALASTAITLVVALPAAALVSRLRGRHRHWIRGLVTVPFVLPTVVVAGAFEGVFFRFGLDQGDFRLRHTVWAILLAHVFFNYAVVVRIVGSFWSGLDHHLEEQARVLGAGPIQTFRAVTLPRLRPAIASASAIVFLFSFTSFGVILLLGGPRRATLETEIYRQAVTRSDLRAAAVLALLQLFAVLALIAVATRLERRRPAPTGVVHRPPKPMRPVFTWANLAMMAVLLGSPIAILVERSLAVGDSYGFDHYRALTERVPQLPASAATALSTSLVFATAATAMALTVGTLTAFVVVHGRLSLRRIFDLGLTLPLGTSAVTIGFGILIALDEPPLDLRTSWWIIPIAHALVGTPFVVRTMVPVLRRIDPQIREAAAVLGASPGRVRRLVDLPIAGRGMLVGAGFAFAVSLGEFGATSFLPRRPETLTAPLALFRLLSTPGELLRGQAMALAVVLMAIVALSVVAIEAARGTEQDFL